MGAKYQPSIKDQKASLRFQRQQATKKPSVKPAPAHPAKPGKKSA
jgi:hypothetical protein